MRGKSSASPRAWPQADLRIVGDAGHAMTEPGIVHELVGATRKFAGGAGRH
jgi:proline iminopeptidase